MLILVRYLGAWLDLWLRWRARRCWGSLLWIRFTVCGLEVKRYGEDGCSWLREAIVVIKWQQWECDKNRWVMVKVFVECQKKGKIIWYIAKTTRVLVLRCENISSMKLEILPGDTCGWLLLGRLFLRNYWWSIMCLYNIYALRSIIRLPGRDSLRNMFLVCRRWHRASKTYH